jgi:hypothetical protein
VWRYVVWKYVSEVAGQWCVRPLICSATGSGSGSERGRGRGGGCF